MQLAPAADYSNFPQHAPLAPRHGVPQLPIKDMEPGAICSRGNEPARNEYKLCMLVLAQEGEPFGQKFAYQPTNK